MIRAVLHLVNAALLAALVVGSVEVFHDLPAEIPRHFGVAGQPDRWAETTWLRWMTMPLVALGSVALTYAAAWFVGRDPTTVNMLDQRRYDALSPAQKRQVVAPIVTMLYGTATFLAGLFAYLQAAAYLVAVGRADGLPGGPLVLVVTLMSSVMVAPLMLWRVQARINRFSRAAS